VKAKASAQKRSAGRTTARGAKAKTKAPTKRKGPASAKVKSPAKKRRAAAGKRPAAAPVIAEPCSFCEGTGSHTAGLQLILAKSAAALGITVAELEQQRHDQRAKEAEDKKREREAAEQERQEERERERASAFGPPPITIANLFPLEHEEGARPGRRSAIGERRIDRVLELAALLWWIARVGDSETIDLDLCEDGRLWFVTRHGHDLRLLAAFDRWMQPDPEVPGALLGWRLLGLHIVDLERTRIIEIEAGEVLAMIEPAHATAEDIEQEHDHEGADELHVHGKALDERFTRPCQFDVLADDGDFTTFADVLARLDAERELPDAAGAAAQVQPTVPFRGDPGAGAAARRRASAPALLPIAEGRS
jgi:hypothetical protein